MPTSEIVNFCLLVHLIHEPSTMWTNEKHSLYLNSLEASFVKQLQHYTALCGSLQVIIRGRYSLRRVPTIALNNSQQEVNFEINEPLLESTADSHFIQRSSRMRHLSSVRKLQRTASPDLPECRGPCSEENYVCKNSIVSAESAGNLEQHPSCDVCHQDLIGGTIEVTDQNFVDEEQRDESSCFPIAKRLKTVGSNASDKDHIVIFEKSNARNVSTINRSFTEREEQVAQQLLSAKTQKTLLAQKSAPALFLEGKLRRNGNEF